MRVEYNGHANDNGIYRIKNTTNNRVYYGSCLRFKSRFKSHSNALASGKHGNRFLQADYNKCQPDDFVFEVVEVVNGDKAARLLREQVYITEYFDNGNQCYNLRNKAFDTREGVGNTNVSDPLNDGRCKPFSEERLAKHVATLKEVWQAPELKEQSRQNAYKQWQEQSQNNITVTNKETGEKVVISGSVRQFCLDRGLSYKAFHQLVKGKLKSSGGWFVGEQEPEYTSKKGQVRKPLSKEHKEKISGGKYVGLKLVNHEGLEIVLTSNVKQQCKDLGLPYSTLIKVLNGKCKSVFGYALAIETR